MFQRRTIWMAILILISFDLPPSLPLSLSLSLPPSLSLSLARSLPPPLSLSLARSLPPSLPPSLPSLEPPLPQPSQAMAAARPVVAVNSGGPLESVPAGVGGFLCAPTAEGFHKAFLEAARLEQAGRLCAMGGAARAHVEGAFSRERLGRGLEECFLEMLAHRPIRPKEE